MKNKDVDYYISGTSRAKRRRKFTYWLIFVISVFYLLFIGLGALTLKTGLFRAKEITITGNKEVAEADIRQALQAQIFGGHFLSYLLGFNNLLIWPDHIKDADKFLPQIKSLDIEKNYWAKTITVRVTERTPYGIWCGEASGGKCFWFDETGKIFKKGPASQGNLVRTVADSSGRPLGLGSAVLPENYFSNLHSIFEVLDQSGLSINSVILKDLELEEVAVNVTSGLILRFSLRFSASWSLPILQNLMAQKQFSGLQYVNFTTENRAYYK